MVSVDQLLATFEAYHLSLWGPFVLLLLCGVGMPIPEDIILITAGYLGATNGHSLVTVMAVMYVGIVAGDSIMFSIGHFIGRRALKWRLIKAFITPERLARAEKLFTKYGTGVIFVGRFLPGLRAPIFFSAGFLKFKYWKFSAMDGFAALISAPLFVWMGHWAGENDTLHVLKEKVGETQAYLILGVAILVVIGVLIKKHRKKMTLETPGDFETKI